MLESCQRRLGVCPTPDGTEAIEEIMADIRPYQTRVARGYPHRRSNRRGPSRLHAEGLQSDGPRARHHRSCRFRHDHAGYDGRSGLGGRNAAQRQDADLVRLRHIRLAAALGRHPGPARRCVLPVVQGQQAQRIGRADGLLGLCRAGRRVAFVDLPHLHQRQHRPDFLRDGRFLRRACRSTATRPSATSPPWARS